MHQKTNLCESRNTFANNLLVWRCHGVRIYPLCPPWGTFTKVEKGHISHIYGNYLGEHLPWCSGLSAGAMRMQTMISPAAVWPGQSWESHQKATAGFPKQNTANTVLSLLLGLVLMICGLIEGCVDEIFFFGSCAWLEVGRGAKAGVSFTLILELTNSNLFFILAYVSNNLFLSE